MTRKVYPFLQRHWRGASLLPPFSSGISGETDACNWMKEPATICNIALPQDPEFSGPDGENASKYNSLKRLPASLKIAVSAVRLRPRAPFVVIPLKSLKNRPKGGLLTLAPPQSCYTVEAIRCRMPLTEWNDQLEATVPPQMLTRSTSGKP